MIRLLLPCLAVLALWSGWAAADAHEFPGIEKLMNKKEFSAAGLEKLSDEERDALNQWLIRYTAFEAAEITKKVDEIKVVQTRGTRTTLKGKFMGWKGKTLFHLNNGQVWKQRSSGRYYPPRMLVNPEVKVSKNALGYDELEVVALGAKIGVKRVK